MDGWMIVIYYNHDSSVPECSWTWTEWNPCCECVDVPLCKPFTYIIEHFVQVGGVHDEVGVAHHVVYGVRLQSKRERKAVKDQFSH